ncbi:MAG: hypothetical protein RIS35_1263, partial [Pseudomonadota bacterium]
AERVARKIVAQLAEPFEVDAHVLLIGASVGVVMFDGTGSGQTPEFLLERADSAMYRAKRAGKDGVGFLGRSGDDPDPLHRPPVR